jgi:signal transduction histidine kinase/ActR/RegA family two-component response regulator
VIAGKDAPADLDITVLQSNSAVAALEKYAAVTHLSVRVYDRKRHMIAAGSESNRLFKLFSASAREPEFVAKCVEACFAQNNQFSSVVAHEQGLAVLGAPFTDDGRVMFVAVAAYALTSHIEQLHIRRLARDTGIAYQSLWDVARSELPIPPHRLSLYGELLRVIGDTILSEHSRGRQLEETLARLQAANQAKDEFLAMLSHELRAPLNTMVGWASMLREGKLDAAATATAVETIERSAKAQKRLVNDLLDVSRIVANKLSLDVQTVDLVSILQRVIEQIRWAADAKNIRLVAELNRNIDATTGDPDRLEQIFSNILSNAVKFTPAGGRIDVNLERIDSAVTVTVSDTGEGIKPEFLPHIFERFRQADSSITKQHGGLGLGLAIVQHLTELHGGRVSAESQGEGRGTTVTVTLPLAHLPLSRREQQKPMVKSDNPAALDGARIWVVDDRYGGRLMLKTLLEKNGARVTALASGYEVLQMLDHAVPDVLLSDIGMPGMDGYTLIREIRARGVEAGGDIPAIAQSGYSSPEECERAIAAGYQMHLAKPFESGELLRAVAKLLAQQTDRSQQRA